MSLGLVLSVPEEGEEGAGGVAFAVRVTAWVHHDSMVGRGSVSEERDPEMKNRHESCLE